MAIEKVWIVYDSRAQYDLDRATVLSTADSLKEARTDAADYPGSVIYVDTVDYPADGGVGKSLDSTYVETTITTGG